MRNKNILMLVNHDVVIYNFRLELVEKLISEGYEVYISSPYGTRIDELKMLGCRYLTADIERHGINPLKDFKLFCYYKRIMHDIKPLAVLSYTIKPNIYGGLSAKLLKIPYITNITGLGAAVEKKGLLQKFVILLYRMIMGRLQFIYFQNTENMQFFLKHKLVKDNYKLLPGSGVNLSRFHLLPYPDTENIEFVFISRIMKEKGINEYLKAASVITEKYPGTRFHICGFCEEDYEEILADYESKNCIIYHGMLRDITDILKVTHCTILPSYYEGMSNALLESAASGRPIIASNIAGCKEIFDEGISGFGIQPGNSEDLIRKIEEFIQLPLKDKSKMGEEARKKVETCFDRNIIVKNYLDLIKNIEEK